MTKFKRSRYTIQHKTNNGEMILYNSLSGSIATVEAEQLPEVQKLLREGFEDQPQTAIEESLLEGGFVVNEEVDERRVNDFKRFEAKYRTDHYGLILMPTEDCNFRCVYCYEDFLRGEMTPEVQNAVVEHIRSKAPTISSLNIAWFGGEPLEAFTSIYNISTEVLKIVEEFNIDYDATMTTNGYHLTEEKMRILNGFRINRFQITLDGPKDVHDAQRILKGGGETYDTILANLRAICATDLEFKIRIRCNFGATTVGRAGELIQELSEICAGDHRIEMYFFPIGRWGGDHDEELTIYPDHNEAYLKSYDLQEEANCLFPDSTFLNGSLDPMGSVCYASLPNSLVIGSDGALYKCTVAFDDPINHVGRLLPDGSLELDEYKFSLWVTSDSTDDKQCRSCFFQPSCQGSACPLQRFRSGKSPCPPTKKNIGRVLEVVVANEKVKASES